MAQAILLTVITVLAVIGLADIIRSVSAWILSGGRRQYILSVIPCKGHEENMEYLIKSAYSHLKELYPCKSCRILLVDYGIDAETKRSCELLCKELDCVLLCDNEEASALLQEKFHLQIEP